MVFGGLLLKDDQMIRMEVTWKRLVSIWKRHQRAPVPLPLYLQWVESGKMTIYEPGNRPSLNTKSTCVLTLDCLGFKTVRSTFLLFISHPRIPVYSILFSSLNGLRQIVYKQLLPLCCLFFLCSYGCHWKEPSF